jgi:hypothetical protein
MYILSLEIISYAAHFSFLRREQHERRLFLDHEIVYLNRPCKKRKHLEANVHGI